MSRTVFFIYRLLLFSAIWIIPYIQPWTTQMPWIHQAERWWPCRAYFWPMHLVPSLDWNITQAAPGSAACWVQMCPTRPGIPCEPLKELEIPCQVWSLIQEDPTCCGAAKSVCHDYRACAREPRSLNCWAHTPKVLKPTGPRARAPQEKPLQWEAHTPQLESSPHSPHLEKSPHRLLKTKHSQK